MSKLSDSTESVVPAEVRELIEESQTIQGWLERLESHVDDARPEVFERVRDDYQGRLDSVTGRLARHRTDLVERLEGRRSEVDALRSDRDSHAAELEEARLRHAVGEFSERRWEDRRGSIEESLGELDALLEIEEAAVTELSGIIGSIDEGGTPALIDAEPDIVVEGVDMEPATESTPAEEVSDEARDEAPEYEEYEEYEDEEDEERAEAEDDASLEAVEEPAPEVEEDAREEEETAVAAEMAGDEAPPAGKKSEPAGDGEEEGGDYLDELEFLESLSLDEADRFDAVSAMLDEEEDSES